MLTPTGACWIFINDENVSELDVAAKAAGFYKRSHVIWHFSFGQSLKTKLSRSHVHLLYYVKTPTAVGAVFNRDDVLVPSMRQLVYKDKRASAEGKTPDDVWVISSRMYPEGFQPDGDTWAESRVCGTFHEKGETPNQLPEILVGRIIKLCSRPGDTVLDPFLGSGTVCAVAKKLGRKCIGFELNAEYALKAMARVNEVKPGDPLFGENKKCNQ